ncbi:hypothetical protein GSI_15637 [Ganoderma sinense ZZ0214-1]|uniref:Phosphatidylglycerol/phosphatidylinositol transfer protein n=1 Tax=Ganoderma sinense ZZ0214-1 TaxID=1077348 RepID=A0A2G8RN62_9APHY|nr:hypothetical protein GSI_15637 [Ganoderma sinense ZZ0214-1]
MKPVLVAALLAGVAAAQTVAIGAPPPNSTFSPGDQFVVEVNKPDSLTNSQDVSVAIGLLSCAGRAPSGTCDGIDPTQELGTVLFAGPYAPQAPPGSTTLVQNYTVTVPADFPSGPALLSVPHFVLVGALFFPSLDDPSETIFIQ